MNWRRIRRKELEKRKKMLLRQLRLYRWGVRFPPGFCLDYCRKMKLLQYEIENGFPAHLEGMYHAFTCLLEDRRELLKRAAQLSTGRVPGRKTLCTLTFINDVADTDAVKILNKFFTVLRKEFKDLLYIWVAERQLKTTNRIHFHVIMNIFLPIKKFNALWCLQQYNAGIRAPDSRVTKY